MQQGHLRWPHGEASSARRPCGLSRSPRLRTRCAAPTSPPTVRVVEQFSSSPSYSVLQEVRSNGDVATLVRRDTRYLPHPPTDHAGQPLSSHNSSSSQSRSSQPDSFADSKPAPLHVKAWAAVRGLFMPDAHSPDYLAYMWWTFPTHVLGNVAHALTTSSLLQAVGLSAGPVATTAASAGLKWLTKEGLGSVGRFLVGGSLAREFDREPQRWRMIAEICTSVGAGLEIATAAFPQHFILLAGGGRFARALGKSIGKPVFRVIQTHFAVDNNVGSIAAKEEVWEVAAQLTGYAMSWAVLTAVDALVVEQGGVSSGTELVAIWAAVQGSHILLRYRSLKSLAFGSLNEQRARALVSDYVAGRPVRSIAAVNRQENILLPPSLCCTPRVAVGVHSLGDVLAAAAACGFGVLEGERSSKAANGAHSVQRSADALLQLYEGESHVLVWRDGLAVAALQEGAPPATLLRVLWQAHWLHDHARGLPPRQALAASVAALREGFAEFEAQARQAGWDTHTVFMGSGDVRYRTQ